MRRIGDGQATRRPVDAAVLLQRDKSRKAPNVGVDDPWGWGRSLEWATSSPPPRHNFEKLPRIRSESPAFDLHHADLALAEYPDNRAGRDNLLDAGEDEGRVEHLGQVVAADTDAEGKDKA